MGNATTKHMREKIFANVSKTDEMQARVIARVGYLHEAVGEEFALCAISWLVMLWAAKNSILWALARYQDGPLMACEKTATCHKAFWKRKARVCYN